VVQAGEEDLRRKIISLKLGVRSKIFEAVARLCRVTAITQPLADKKKDATKVASLHMRPGLLSREINYLI
jgi:hypothetical protein